MYTPQYTPQHTQLCTQSLLVAAALITGELIGHPLELRHRAAFAREIQAAGGVLPAATSEVAAARLLHPLR